MKTVQCPKCEQPIPQGTLKATERLIVGNHVLRQQPIYESECPNCGPVMSVKKAIDLGVKPN